MIDKGPFNGPPGKLIERSNALKAEGLGGEIETDLAAGNWGSFDACNEVSISKKLIHTALDESELDFQQKDPFGQWAETGVSSQNQPEIWDVD